MCFHIYLSFTEVCKPVLFSSCGTHPSESPAELVRPQIAGDSLPRFLSLLVLGGA